jgi:DNA-binding beta-propeller fold protein YncE
VTTVAGTCTILDYADGPPGSAGFNGPHGLTVNKLTGIVYVADRFNHAIRRIDTAGNVTTIAGNPPVPNPNYPGPNEPVHIGTAGFADGSPGAFNWPGALTVDPGTGDVYLTDYNNNAVRRLTSITSTSSTVSTVVGIPPLTSPNPVGVVLGSLSGALSGPTSIVALPAVPAQNVPLQLELSDALENAILLATMP